MKTTRIALIMTLIWFLVVVILVNIRWNEVSKMPLNNLGDFLAGVTSPIAFFWLILGYFQQSRELQLNTQALTDQKYELQRQSEMTAEMVKHNERLARATEKQVSVSKSQEMSRRAENMFKKK